MLKERVCIVGLGLMGGSMALALKLAHRMSLQPFSLHLTLVDTDPHTIAAVQKLGDRVTDDFSVGVEGADFLILATPVRTIIQLLQQLPDVHRQGCMVMDLGSSKVEIGRVMSELPAHFSAIGGHPLCGRETAGFGVATPDLYRDKNFVLCTNKRTTPLMQMQANILLELIGAYPLYLQDRFHDDLVAAISHLPYIVSAGLMRTVAALNNDLIWSLSATGFRDTARVSGTDPTMMRDILLTNKTAVLQQLNRYQNEMAKLITLVSAEDENGLQAWLVETQQGYFSYKNSKKER